MDEFVVLRTVLRLLHRGEARVPTIDALRVKLREAIDFKCGKIFERVVLKNKKVFSEKEWIKTGCF